MDSQTKGMVIGGLGSAALLSLSYFINQAYKKPAPEATK